jgi:hypothetical protein
LRAAEPLPGARVPGPAERGLTLLVREECELCEEMLAALAALARRVALPQVITADVDSDPQWQRRYGLKVPVLLLDGTPVCRTRLDEAQLLGALRRRGDRL